MLTKWNMMVPGLVFLIVSLIIIDQTGLPGTIKLKVQEGLLYTGLIQADTNLSEEEKLHINYDVPLKTLNGEQESLADFRGKVIFLNFWASWCGPCRIEMPNIQALYEQYQSREDVKFIMVSLDQRPEKARKYLEKNGYTFGSYMLTGDRPEKLKSKMIPATFVISKEAIIVAKKEGIANYNTAEFRNFLETLLEK